MARIDGLYGLRPTPETVKELSAPPYDVIKEGSPLESLLQKRPLSLVHATLGSDPAAAVQNLIAQKALIEDSEPCFYVYEQCWKGSERLGFFAAVECLPYSQGHVVRHEKVFDEKVKGRIEVSKATGVTLEPIFLLTASPIQPLLEKIRNSAPALYLFESDFDGYNDLHGIRSRIFRIPQSSKEGQELRQVIAQNPLYIADGHHRYHAALLGGQTHAMAYIVEQARILAYNRVIRGKIPFEQAKSDLKLEKVSSFTTPEKNAFCIYTKNGTYLLRAENVPSDVVGKLDCSILERELYPKLGVTHDMVLQKCHFDYYPEHDLDTMKTLVDSGEYEIAVALHPVSIQELMDVANAGMGNPEIVMPEKSTFFAPKILSGLIIYKHSMKATS